MSNIFISYSRADEDKDKVTNIVQDVQSLDHNAWFDHELTGGQNWWNKILGEIRNTDIFIFILSPESRESAACRRECDYAHALGKPILPIQVADGVSTNLLPPALSQVQIVDYLKADKEAYIRLSRALSRITTSKPLPEPPEVPLSYLGSITQQIESNADLSYQQQSVLLVDIKQCLRDSDVNEEDAITLLKKLRKRWDLYAGIADELDTVIETIKIDSVSYSTAFEEHDIEQKPIEADADYEKQTVVDRRDEIENNRVTIKERILMSLVYGIIGTIIFFLFLYPYYTDRSYINERYHTFISYILERVIERGEFMIGFIPFAIAGAINGKRKLLLFITTITALIAYAAIFSLDGRVSSDTAPMSLFFAGVTGIVMGLFFIIKKRRKRRSMEN